MGKIRIVGRLVRRDLRRRPGPAVLMVLAITAATATLTLGLVLHGVTRQPYQQTKAATRGPDVVAEVGGSAFSSISQGPIVIPASVVAGQVKELTHAPGVTAYSGPYPVASAVLRVRGLTAALQAEGRTQAAASVDQPAVTAGTWVRPGGIVLERTFADALGVGVGDRVTLDGRAFRVVGTAVTDAAPPYPNMCYPPGGDCAFDYQGNLLLKGPGLGWITEPDARSLASAQAPLSYVVNLKLRNPATAEAFAQAYGGCVYGRCAGSFANAPRLTPWQYIAQTDGQLVLDEQQVLSPGALLAGLLAVASVAVLAGGRMAEQTRRIGLLKAVGGSPGLVTVVFLAENVALALAAAAAGLAIGWLAAPAVTNPGAGLVGTPGAPSLTWPIIGEVVAVALVVALAGTVVPAIRASWTSTVSALADAVRRPRRRPLLIAFSALLPVPMLLGLRLVARRPRRAVLSAASVAVTATGLVATLCFHTTVHLKTSGPASGLGNPVITRDEQMLTVLTVVLVALTVLNAICAAWATVLDARRASALARALGTTPEQVSAGIAMAQVLPAVPGALLGVPLGIGLYSVAAHGITVTVPPVWWLAAAVLGIVAVVGALSAVPARLSARRSVIAVLDAETD